jgi:hypothetical protein
MKAAAARIALAVLVGYGTGCALLKSGRRPEGCPVAPVAVARLADRLPLRARMRLTGPGLDIGLETIASLEGEALVVVGLAPYGIRLFAIRQRGGEAEILDDRSASAAAAPVWAMDALHRSLWIQAPDTVGRGRDVSWERAGETVRDRVAEDGRRNREFTRPRGHGRVSIEYPVLGSGSEPEAIAIRNPWCGYEGRIVVLDGPAR